MTPLRLRKIDLQGFRAFGTGRQSASLSDSVTALWGGNSQGKTSFAEAVEFLLTGKIARRDLLASAKDEFSQALKNAHLAPGAAAFVEAEIMCADGTVRKLRRTLEVDYDGNADCVSKLELDGAACTEADIELRVGLKLLHPPLCAPVLAQHTLAYVFTAPPSDRAAYFRAVLDTQDLEDFRKAVAGVRETFPEPNPKEIVDLNACGKIAEASKEIIGVAKAVSEEAVAQGLDNAIAVLLRAIGLTPSATAAAWREQLADALKTRREQAFPLELFGRKAFPEQPDLATGLASSVGAFDRERAAVHEDVRRLVTLFEAVLAIPAIATCANPVDCPVCGTEQSLTPGRVGHLKAQLEANAAYQSAEKAVRDELRTVVRRLQSLGDALQQALPRFTEVASKERRAQGFTVARIAALSGNARATTEWAKAARELWRTTTQLSRAIAAARWAASAALEDVSQWSEGAALIASLEGICAVQNTTKVISDGYGAAAQAIGESLKTVVDQSAHTEGWQELVALAADPKGLFQAMQVLRAHAAEVKALDQALKEIDTANGKVADEKFTDLSGDVADWWERLRPGEPAFFSSVGRRGTRTRRNVDLKVALSAKDDRSNPKFRDAVAVFSQSQLHCLGLSLFLARALDGGAGFVLLDDPVLTSDDDFRPNFASTVIEALLDAGVQVIVVTQDYASWKDIGHRWGFRNATQYQLVRDDPVIGTEIRNVRDELTTLLAQAQPFINSQDGEQRKKGAGKLRDAIERFCKEMLVRSRQAKGDVLASITDYDGKNFGEFSAQVQALLKKDPSHPGKLVAAHNYVTPGAHDDKPPSTGELKFAAGDIKRLKKDYLD